MRSLAHPWACGPRGLERKPSRFGAAWGLRIGARRVAPTPGSLASAPPALSHRWQVRFGQAVEKQKISFRLLRAARRIVWAGRGGRPPARASPDNGFQALPLRPWDGLRRGQTDAPAVPGMRMLPPAEFPKSLLSARVFPLPLAPLLDAFPWTRTRKCAPQYMQKTKVWPCFCSSRA